MIWPQSDPTDSRVKGADQTGHCAFAMPAIVNKMGRRPSGCRLHRDSSVTHMDRSTKATLWVAFIVLFSYFAWFFLECAMDPSCHLVCSYGGRNGCHTQRTPDLKSR